MPAPAAEDPVELLRLGARLLEQGRPAEAAAPLYRAVALDPGGVDGHYILGLAQQGLGQHELAMASYARAIELYPAGHAEAHNNLGNVLQSLGRCEEALPHFDAALAAEPRYALAMNNRGNALKALGRYRDAIASHRAALAVDPSDALAHFSIGLAQLALGEFDDGWSEYEWRYPHAGAPPRSEVRGAWNGEDLHGRSILLHGEQGLGDTIQFVRYAPLVADLGAVVSLQVQPALVPLLRKVPGVHRVCSLGEPAPPADFQCPLMSLPFLFGTTLETVPPPGTALAVDPAAAARRRAALGGHAGEKLVGVCWRGSPQHVYDRLRSIRFAALAPLWSVPRVRFVSLQMELTNEERALADALPQLAHPGADFEITAETVAGLDLVVSVDTSVAHLAGALGKPVWILLHQPPDWRWLLEREDSPWYPSARLFRQGAARDWGEVIARVAAALREAAAA